jgi:diacylglycerol O-acyltransferase / wax synthase
MVERLSPEDARILELERGNVRGHTCKLLIVAGEHRAEAVRELVAGRLATVSRLRQRLVPAPWGLAPPALVEDEDFRIERHVRDGGRAGGDEEVRATVARLMAEPLDRNRPLWAIDVLALDGPRTALVWRLHHAIADGTIAMRMARSLLFDEGESGAASPGAADEPGLVDALRWRGTAVAGRAAGAGRAALSPGNWTRAARGAARLPGALRRELGRTARSSPLDRPAGAAREVAFFGVSLEELKAIAHGASERATVNDVVLAAVAGGLRDWLGAAGAEQAAMRVKVPVSLHTSDEADGANVDSFMCVDLPIAEPDPTARLQAVTRETRERKSLHDAQTLAAFFADLSHLSRSLERFAEHWSMSPRVFTLNVSNVPGPAEPQRVLGEPLLELYSLAEIAHRHALRVAVVSAGGRISFGLCADAEALGGLDAIASGIRRELGELRANL